MPDTILNNAGTSSVVQVNSKVLSTVDFGNDSDWYKVSLMAGSVYQFDLVGRAADGIGLTLADPLLGLRDITGALIALDDDAGVGLNARIYFKPTVSGDYYLDAQSATLLGTGSYTLIVNDESDAAVLSVGSSIPGSVSFNGDTDFFRVPLVADVSYVFTLSGTTLSDPYLELADMHGAVIATDDDSGAGFDAALHFTPVTTGTYFLSARASSNGSTGSYLISSTQVPVVSVEDAFSLERNGDLTTLTFDVRMSAPSLTTVSVVASTLGTSTALGGVDYVSTTTTITFSPGQTLAKFAVQIIDDTEFEPVEIFSVALTNPSGAILDQDYGYGFIIDNDEPYQLPVDELVNFQWYLYPTTGVNALVLWPEYTGKGVRVAVFDQGIDPAHPELDNNLIFSLGRNASTLTLGGDPVLLTDSHGTAVAGTIAAERNGTGIVGVAHGASLISIYSPLQSSGLGASITNAYNYAKSFDVLNDSWGFAGGFSSGATWAFYDDFNSPQFSAAGQALANLAANGRNGLGTVVVQSAGNHFELGDDTNLHNFQNSQYIITVAATDYFGQTTSYSSPGASVLVAAPGGTSGDVPSGIWTTDRVGPVGYESIDYTSSAGTSFSAPIVSGVVALMLEANSNLGYRDVQEILAITSRLIAPTSNTWKYNGATQWNGGGMHYDALTHDLGFGLVDARAAVRLSETWQTISTASNREQISATRSPYVSIPDNSTQGAIDSVNIAQGIQVERVEVTLKVTHSFIGDLSVLLLSPSGTTSFLLWRPQQGSLSAFGSSRDNINFTFTTVLNWGESSAGVWSLGVFDAATGDTGSLDSWTINIVGKQNSVDNIYVFTDEYAESLAVTSARGMLNDLTGIDTLNASAVSSDSILSLNSGTASRIDAATFQISSTTTVENAIGGDGNDTITGNNSNNDLKGMRGNDLLIGGDGDDTITGGAGIDAMIGDVGNDAFLIALAADHATGEVITGGEGTDVIRFTSTVAATLTLLAGVNVEEARITNAAGVSTGKTNESINAMSATGAIALYGNDGANTLTGNESNNYISGGAGNDKLIGGGGDDTLIGLAGDDVLVGGSGIDTAVFNSSKLNFSITHTGGTISVSGSAIDGNDTLNGVERLKFTDQSLAFDFDGNAGFVAKLLGVLIGKSNWYNKPYIGIGLEQLDNELLNSEQLMSFALKEVLGENASNGAVVNLLYTNLVGAGPSLAEYNNFVGLLENGTYTQTSLSMAAAGHELNTANIGLIGLIDSGLEYIPVV